ncbi:MAG: hypothetical protein GZ089_10940 [Aromatoleum sp.]|nr:hypothetical protein [Aromatoleum sp.]
MFVTRSIRKAVSRLLIGVLLFAQLAVASYACPGLSGSTSTTAAGVTSWAPVQAATEPSASVAGCEHVDASAANLCAGHCQHGQQSADTAPVPVVHAAIPTFLYSLPIEPELLLGSGRSHPAPDASLAAAPPPPHAILHCVFRT